MGNPIYDRMVPTTAALQAATSAVRSPFPAEALAALQPTLRIVVRDNDAALANAPSDTPAEGIASLRRSNELLRYAATVNPANHQSFLERLANAPAKAAETAMDIGKIAIAGLAILLLIVILK